MGRLLWMWNYRAKSSFILSFIYLFVSLFAHAIVRAYRMPVSKKKTSDAGPVEEWAGARQNGVTCFFLLQRSCSHCVDTHAHADLELCWSYVFLDGVTYFMWVFFSIVKTQRPSSDCADAHTCICWSRTLLVRCFLGITFYLFFLFLQRSWPAHFTYVYLLQRPRSNCMDAHYTELSNIFDTTFHLR